MSDHKKSLENVNKNMIEFAKALPDEMKGFMNMNDAAI